jgi:mycobactin lysine-N-oxygenase
MSLKNRLIILGAGPKALAIAAKSSILNELGKPVPEIIVVEKEKVAANWSGKFGYTDGDQELGTRPEKDVGFPYLSTCWGNFNNSVNEGMNKFSWQTFLIEQNKYSDWLDRGRPQPTHKRFSEYLTWVADKSKVNVKKGEVIRITQSDGCWRLHLKGGDTIDGEGLVITGPGEPQKMIGQPDVHHRIADGKNFWKSVVNLQLQEISIGIIGTGETAASIAVTLLKSIDRGSNIEIVNPHGTIYSRGESFIENTRFSNPDSPHPWSELIEEDRLEFIDRTDRGVFSVQAKSILDVAEIVKTRTGRVKNIKTSESDILVNIDYAGVTKRQQYDYVVIATGFDPLWFKALLDEHIIIRDWSKEKIEQEVEYDLSLKNYSPRIHIPMLAAFAQGPGFPNLSCLGLLSDRVLSSYVKVMC